MVIPHQFDEVSPFRDGISFVRMYNDDFSEYTDGVLHDDGNYYLLHDADIASVITPNHPELIIIIGYNGYGLADLFANTLLATEYEDVFPIDEETLVALSRGQEYIITYKNGGCSISPVSE